MCEWSRDNRDRGEVRWLSRLRVAEANTALCVHGGGGTARLWSPWVRAQTGACLRLKVLAAGGARLSVLRHADGCVF